MFGNIGQLASLLKNAGQIKQNLEQMNERLAAARFVGESGAGQVTATVNGRGEITALKIDPALVTSGGVELIEELVVAAVRDATSRSRDALQKESMSALGGMNVPGLDSLFGK